MTSVAARARGVRLRRDRHQPLDDRLRRPRAARQGDRRLPQRHQGPRGRRQGLEAVSGRGSASSASTTGGRTSSGTSTTSPSSPGSATSTTRTSRPLARAVPARARDERDFDDLLADDTLDAVVIATPVPTHYALAKQALEAGKHVFVEKPPAMRAAEMDELVAARRRARPRADAGPPAALPPRRPEAEGARRRRRARRRAVRLRQPRRTSASSARTRTRSGRSACTTSRVILYLLDEDPDLATAQGSCVDPRRASRTSSSASSASRAGRSRTCTSRGSTRTRCGR